MEGLKVAIVHDWLTGMRGGEKCLQAFLRIYPQADIYTLLHVPGSTSDEIDRRVKGTSFFQKLPGIERYYRLLLPLYPLAVRSLNLEGYDMVISLSHAAAKNVRVPRGARHVSYCFTPMRYIWDQAEIYFRRLTPLLWPLIKSLRHWDKRATCSVDEIVGISRFVAARIRCYYGRKATVIYPPVDTSWIQPIHSYSRGEAFLYAGALVPYKNVDQLVEVFNRLGHELWIAGKGPEEKKLRKMAGRNIRFLGPVSDAELARLYAGCRALLFPAIEDFGMIPIECMAAGRPVIGLYAGALKESLNGVKPWINSHLAAGKYSGVFIDPHMPDRVDSIARSVNFFIENEQLFEPASCIARAELFSPLRFYSAWADLVVRKKILPLPETRTDAETETRQYA